MHVRTRIARRAGFTLVEIMLVILILVMLAGAAAIVLSGTREGAKIDTTKIKIDKVMKAVELYANTGLPYPEEDSPGLRALIEKPDFEDESMAAKWRGPYLTEDDLKDAWGKELKYTKVTDETTSQTKVRVYSYGPNGNDDSGEGDDIKNRAWASEGESSGG